MTKRIKKTVFPRGFTLTELTIVLGVVGLILASVWGSVSRGWDKAKQDQTSQQVKIVVDGVRAYYSGQLALPATYDYTITAALLATGTIPVEMQRGSSTVADTVWGPQDGSPLSVDANGTFRVCNWTGSVCGSPAALVSQFFGIELLGLNQVDCMALATHIGSPLGPTGLADVIISNSTTNDLKALSKPINPVSPND